MQIIGILGHVLLCFYASMFFLYHIFIHIFITFQATDKAEQQKCQFRTNIEELKAKLHETIVNRDTVLELRYSSFTFMGNGKFGLYQWFSKCGP